MSWLTDWFVGGMTEQEQADNLKKTQDLAAKRIAAREAAGTLTPEEESARYQSIFTQQIDGQDQAAADGFVEGAKEGLQNVLDAPGKVVGAVGDASSSMLWGIVKNIPWWVWVGGAVALFVWLGGLMLIRGKLAKAA